VSNSSATPVREQPDRSVFYRTDDECRQAQSNCFTARSASRIEFAMIAGGGAIGVRKARYRKKP